MEIPLRKVINIIESYPLADFVFGGGEFTLYSQKDELLNYSDRVILDEGPISGDTKNYNNQLQVPSYFNLKGGEGAVIIVW